MSEITMDGYVETIQLGKEVIGNIEDVYAQGSGTYEENIASLKRTIQQADAVVIGAGDGLSQGAGLIYNGDIFDEYFKDFQKKYGVSDMYSGGFYPFEKPEIYWAWWARYIYCNRYMPIGKQTYRKLLNLVQDKEYFVITTNADHLFRKAGFDTKRLFFSQGDYGRFQSVVSQVQKTFPNRNWVMEAMEAQGFIKNKQGHFQPPRHAKLNMEIPSELIPKNPFDGSDVRIHLRWDENFVQDHGWQESSQAYGKYLKKYKDKNILYLEIGVGPNTPVIIKYPFWALTIQNPKATYANINLEQAFCPKQIVDRSICIQADAKQVIEDLLKENK